MMPPQAWPSCQALCVSVGPLASGWFRIVAILDNAGQDDRVAVGKLGDQGEFAARRLDIARQGKEQNVGAFFKARHGVLGNAQAFDADLRELAGVAQLLSGHLLGYELVRAGLYFFAPCGA
jgi:hypothetical protein